MSKGDGNEHVATQIQAPLNTRTLGFQTSLFKLTMKSHAKAAMEEPRDRNLVTKLWEKIGNNALMLNRLSEFFKVAEIAVTAVLGSIEDEWTFSTLGFMKSKLQNRLGGHLDICVKFFSQPFFTLANFPYADAIAFWSDELARRGSAQ
jgi:DNA primase large subunit